MFQLIYKLEMSQKKVWRQGKCTYARRPLEYDEFEKLVRMICAYKNPLKKYGFVALVASQFQFLARADDTCALMVDEIKSHNLHKDSALN